MRTRFASFLDEVLESTGKSLGDLDEDDVAHFSKSELFDLVEELSEYSELILDNGSNLYNDYEIVQALGEYYGLNVKKELAQLDDMEIVGGDYEFGHEVVDDLIDRMNDRAGKSGGPREGFHLGWHPDWPGNLMEWHNVIWAYWDEV